MVGDSMEDDGAVQEIRSTTRPLVVLCRHSQAATLLQLLLVLLHPVLVLTQDTCGLGLIWFSSKSTPDLTWQGRESKWGVIVDLLRFAEVLCASLHLC